MRTPWILALALLIPFPAVVCAGDTAEARVAPEEGVQDKVIELGAQDNRVMEGLHYLVNVIGPRLTSSHNDHIACEWAKGQLEAAGLQNVVMEAAGEFPVAFHRGPWSGKMIAPEEMVLEFGTPAWSAGTRGVVTGLAMVPPASIEGLDPADYAGAWILGAAGGGGRREGRGQGQMTPEQRAEMQERRQAQREVQTFLTDAGVAGFITPTRNKYITTNGNARIDPNKLPTTPQINMMKDHYDAVMAQIEAGKEVKLQFDIRNHFEKGPAKFYNVYGDIVGTDFPDEYVIIGGHIDSWDGATGTTDNGMGAATTMEAARLLVASGAKPRRTIRFMLWSGEEQGLLGSKAYVEKNPELLEKISAVLVYDGGPNAISSLPTTKAMHSQMEQAFASVVGLNPELPFELKQQEKGLPRGIGSDHESFLPKGVPAFFWTQEGRADWRHGIHTQFDTYDLAIPEYLEHSVVVIALGAFGLANLDGLLDRTELSAPGGGGFGGGGGRRMGVFLDELLVEGVTPDSPAEAAGIQAKDVFFKIDGTVIENREGLVQAIQKGGPEKTVIMKRDGKEVSVKLIWPEEKKAEEEKKKEEAKKKEKTIL